MSDVIQLSFDDVPVTPPLDVPARRLARRSDPATSKTAARLNHNSARARVLQAFAAGHPLTYAQAAELAGIEPWQASKRVADLRNDGLIAYFERDGIAQTDDSHGGAPRSLYRITPEGTAALRTTTTRQGTA